MTSSRWRLLAVCAALASGCEDAAPPPESGLSGKPVQGLSDALLYVANDHARAEAVVVDVAREKPRVVRRALPEGQITSQPRAGRSGEALLLSAGTAAGLVGGKGRDAVNSFLLVYDRDGEQARYELSGRYQQLAQSADGRFAIAYAASGSWSSADSIAVIDFAQARPDAPVPSTSVRALNGEGPSAIAFAPPGSARRLAVLVMTDAINLIDLEQPDRSDKVLPLKLPNGSASLRAVKVLFHEDRCFVQSDNSSDVLVVRVEDDADSPSGFRASLLTLATESVVRDIALIEPDSASRLLALSANGLRVIDTVTGDGETTRTGSSFDQALLFEGRSPFDDEARPRALLAAANSSQLGFVDLQAELSGRERSVEIVNLNDSVQEIVMAESRKLAVVRHGSARVSLVDLEQRTVSRIDTEATPRQLLVDADDGRSQVWIATVGGGVGVIDLARRSATPLLLDRPAESLLFVPGRTPRVAVAHLAVPGRLTLVAADHPSREEAREIVGFAYSGFFD